MSLNGLIDDLQTFCRSAYGTTCTVSIAHNTVHIYLSDNDELTFTASNLSDVRFGFTMFKLGKRNIRYA